MSSLQDIFIKLDGIDGESKDAKHKGWIQVNSFGYSVSQSSSASTGGGSGVGRANFDVLTFTHDVDRASPNLFAYCAMGKHIPKVELSVCKSGGEASGGVEYLNVQMEDVVVTYVALSGANSQSQVPETVALSYSKIKIQIREQDGKGGMKPPVEASWDIKANARY